MIELVVVLGGNGSVADRNLTIGSLTRNTTDLEVRVFDPQTVDSSDTLDTAVKERVCLVISEGATDAACGAHVWDVIRSAPNADVVLLELGVTVGPNWLERLRDAAYADTVVATASAVPVDMLTFYKAPRERLEVALTESVREAALGEPLWGCVYIRRDAVRAAIRAGWTDDDPLARPIRLEKLVLVPGLVHVLASTVVLSPAHRAAPGRVQSTPAMRRSLAEVEAQVERLRVAIDLRCCAFPLSGTQVHALNLVSSLATTDGVQLSILLPARVDPSVRPHVSALPEFVRRHTVGKPMIPEPHVFHRPYQLLSETEITDVVSSGVRLVITHQDMILDRTPAYFESSDQWLSHSAATALTFVAADEVVFFSEHARREAVREGLVDLTKTSVVPPGTNHLDDRFGEEEMPPVLAAAMNSESRPFVLVIGNAYIHKNRLFALRVVEELNRACGWNGVVVFAGGNPKDGSSEGEENAFLQAHEDVAAKFVDLGRVSDAGRSWLYRHTALVLFPTLYEGFGLVPFEAAAAGTPCVYSSRSSVAEYLPPEGALLELGDVVETARRLHLVLGSREAGDEIVRQIRRAGSELTWSRAADSYVEIYRRAMTRPIGLSLVVGRNVIVGARSQLVASETERRILLLVRRSAVLRVMGETIIALAIATRGLARRVQRVVRQLGFRA